MTEDNSKLTPAFYTLLAPLLALDRRRDIENDPVWGAWAKSDAGVTYLRILEQCEHDSDVQVTFEEAKTIIYPMLDPVGFNETPSRGPVYMRHWFGPRPLYYGRSVEALRLFIELSEKEHDYWEALCLITARLLRENDPLDDDLRLWLADVMDGKRKPPKRKPGKRPYANVGRDIHIRTAITILEGLGLQPTRNVESTRRESACDVVAAVLAEHGHSLSYQAIATIWTDAKTWRKYEDSQGVP